MNEWNGGKYAGHIHFDEHAQAYAVTFEIGDEKFTENFCVKNYDSKNAAARNQAELYQRKICEKKNWIKNQWKFCQDDQSVMMKVGSTTFVHFNRQHLESLEPITWYAKKSRYTYYACGKLPSTKKIVNMHRLILPHFKQIDHIDRNGLNNRGSNLRDGSGCVNANNRKVNLRNTTGYNGISPQKTRFIVGWRENGKPCTKSFSFRKYGSKEKALDFAVAFRNDVYQRIGNDNGN